MLWLLYCVQPQDGALALKATGFSYYSELPILHSQSQPSQRQSEIESAHWAGLQCVLYSPLSTKYLPFSPERATTSTTSFQTLTLDRWPEAPPFQYQLLPQEHLLHIGGQWAPRGLTRTLALPCDEDWDVGKHWRMLQQTMERLEKVHS